MSAKDLASTISIRSIVERKNGHSRYISRSSARSPSRPSVNPSHAGTMKRDCDHAKTHGMARSEATSRPG